jgi:hypothetical protein
MTLPAQSETDSHFNLSVLELDCSDSPHFVRSVVRKASSNSSTRSDWFDVGLMPENVRDEDWPDASDAVVDAYFAVAVGPSSHHRGSGRAPHLSRGWSRIRTLEDDTSSWGRRPVRQKSATRKPRSQSSAPKKPRGRKHSHTKPL